MKFSFWYKQYGQHLQSLERYKKFVRVHRDRLESFRDFLLFLWTWNLLPNLQSFPHLVMETVLVEISASVESPLGFLINSFRFQSCWTTFSEDNLVESDLFSREQTINRREAMWRRLRLLRHCIDKRQLSVFLSKVRNTTYASVDYVKTTAETHKKVFRHDYSVVRRTHKATPRIKQTAVALAKQLSAGCTIFGEHCESQSECVTRVPRSLPHRTNWTEFCQFCDHRVQWHNFS